MRLAYTAAILMLLAGCRGIRTPSGTPTDRRLPPSDVPGATTPGKPKSTGITATSKRIATKHAPNTLVATDSSRCVVSDEQYQEARVGDSFVCAWDPPPSKSGT